VLLNASLSLAAVVQAQTRREREREEGDMMYIQYRSV
jgi:hypothetical protein